MAFSLDEFMVAIKKREQEEVVAKMARRFEPKGKDQTKGKAQSKSKQRVKEQEEESYYGSDRYLEDGDEARGSIYG